MEGSIKPHSTAQFSAKDIKALWFELNYHLYTYIQQLPYGLTGLEPKYLEVHLVLLTVTTLAGQSPNTLQLEMYSRSMY